MKNKTNKSKKVNSNNWERIGGELIKNLEKFLSIKAKINLLDNEINLVNDNAKEIFSESNELLSLSRKTYKNNEILLSEFNDSSIKWLDIYNNHLKDYYLSLNEIIEKENLIPIDKEVSSKNFVNSNLLTEFYSFLKIDIEQFVNENTKLNNKVISEQFKKYENILKETFKIIINPLSYLEKHQINLNKFYNNVSLKFEDLSVEISRITHLLINSDFSFSKKYISKDDTFSINSWEKDKSNIIKSIDNLLEKEKEFIKIKKELISYSKEFKESSYKEYDNCIKKTFNLRKKILEFLDLEKEVSLRNWKNTTLLRDKASEKIANSATELIINYGSGEISKKNYSKKISDNFSIARKKVNELDDRDKKIKKELLTQISSNEEIVFKFELFLNSIKINGNQYNGILDDNLILIIDELSAYFENVIKPYKTHIKNIKI